MNTGTSEYRVAANVPEPVAEQTDDLNVPRLEAGNIDHLTAAERERELRAQFVALAFGRLITENAKRGAAFEQVARDFGDTPRTD